MRLHVKQAQDKPITEEFNEGWEEGRHAADVEIMQLRAEIERLQKEWLSLYGVERMRFEAIQRMTAEIERLRDQMVDMQGETFAWMKKHNKLLAFIQARPAMLKELIEEEGK
jgi:muramidase (phage lysozyme)